MDRKICAPPPDLCSVSEQLRRIFGFEPSQDQLRAISWLIFEKRDLILIARTGFGKSLVFQAVALLRGGVTLIITPLLAIEEEQVADLKKLGGFTPVALNGLTNTPKLLRDIQNGLYSHS
jgi:superfamily II DNA helicase RecQ